MKRRALPTGVPIALLILATAGTLTACSSTPKAPPADIFKIPTTTMRIPPTPSLPARLPDFLKAADASTQVVNTATFDIGTLVQAAESSVRNYWTTAFSDGDLARPLFSYVNVLPGRKVATACFLSDGTPGSAGDPNTSALDEQDAPALYCPADDTIYLSLSWLDSEVRNLHPSRHTGDLVIGGDFAVAVIVAHETGHAVQKALAIEDPDYSSVVRTELQADCLAGLWANSQYWQGNLDPDDIGVAADALNEGGTYDFFSGSFHGTPGQREEAFNTGYRSGRFSDCPLTVTR